MGRSDGRLVCAVLEGNSESASLACGSVSRPDKGRVSEYQIKVQ